MKAEYYAGIVSKNAGKYDEAIGRFLKAYDLSKEVGDPFWQGLSTRQISMVFNKTANSTESLIYDKISYGYFKKAGIENYIDYAMEDLSVSYYNEEKLDSSIYFSKILLKKGIEQKIPWLEYEARENLGLAYIKAKQYANAIEVLLPAKHPEGEHSHARAYLGLALVKNGDTKRGLEIMDSLKRVSAPSLEECYFSYELYTALADTTNAFKALQKLYDKLDESFDKRKSSGLGATILRIHEMQKDLDKARIENQRYRVILLSILIFIITCGAIAGYWGYRHWIKSRIRKISKKSGSLTEMLECIGKESLQQKESIESLLYTQFSQVNDACMILHETGKTDRTNKKIAKSMMEMIEFLSDERRAIDKLGKLVDRHCDNLFTNFRNDFPTLKNNGYVHFLLKAVGFSSTAIGELMGIEIKSVYSRGDRLRNKVNNSDSPYKERYIRILTKSGAI